MQVKKLVQGIKDVARDDGNWLEVQVHSLAGRVTFLELTGTCFGEAFEQILEVTERYGGVLSYTQLPAKDGSYGSRQALIIHRPNPEAGS